VKATRADVVLVCDIGENAKQNLRNIGIEVKRIGLKNDIQQIIKEILKENERK